MDADAGDAQQPYGDAGPEPGPASGPSEDERRVLTLWKSGLVSQDPRYENKALLKLAARAMIDAEFRARLVSDGERVIEELGLSDDLPKGARLEFFENTPDTLRVVLPPFRGGLDDRTPGFRERLRSRTSEESLRFFKDDIDLGDWGDPIPGGGSDHGDPDTRDSSNSAIVLKE